MNFKRILFVMTGGTIASVDNGAGLEPGDDNFFQPIVDEQDCQVTFTAPFYLDSSQITPEHWEQLALLVDQQKSNYDGIVITHGTDTMAYTAAALTFYLQGLPLPVILTGSQIPINAAGSDGAANVKLSILAAQSDLKGVFVAFDGRIMHGASCSKTYSENKIGFESINVPYVALEEDTAVTSPYRFQRPVTKKVCLLKIVPTMTPDLFQTILAQGYSRIVLEAYGKGGIPDSFFPAIRTAVQQGVRVGLTTQCAYEGSDCYIYKVGRELLDAGVLDYKKHTTEYAVADMMFRK